MMIVGVCFIELLILNSNSLKNKRQIVKSIIGKIKNRFNVSIAEFSQDHWQRSKMGIACINDKKLVANGIFNKIIQFIEANPDVEISNLDMESL